MTVKPPWQRYGVRAAAGYLGFRLLRRLIDLNVTRLMWLDLHTLPTNPSASSTNTAAVRLLTADELHQAAAHNPQLELTPEFSQRVSAGSDYCFGIYRGGQLVAYYWLARGSIEAEHNRAGCIASGVALSFADDVIYGYKALVLPAHRGRGLYAELVSGAAQWMRQHHGARYLISTVDWTNFAALSSCRRQGMQSLGTIWRIGCRGRYRTLTSAALRRLPAASLDAATVGDGKLFAGNTNRRRVTLLDLRIGDDAVVQPRLLPADDASAAVDRRSITLPFPGLATSCDAGVTDPC